MAYLTWNYSSFLIWDFFAIITFTNLDQGGGTTSVFAFYCGKLASVAKDEGAVGITISITLHILNMVLSSVSCTD